MIILTAITEQLLFTFSSIIWLQTIQLNKFRFESCQCSSNVNLFHVVLRSITTIAENRNSLEFVKLFYFYCILFHFILLCHFLFLSSFPYLTFSLFFFYLLFSFSQCIKVELIFYLLIFILFISLFSRPPGLSVLSDQGFTPSRSDPLHVQALFHEFLYVIRAKINLVPLPLRFLLLLLLRLTSYSVLGSIRP